MDKKEFDEGREMYSSPREYVDCLPVGWSKIYLDMIDEMDAVAGPDNYYIWDVKEKYGTMRVEFTCVDHYYEYRKIVDFYDDLSWYTCCKCGKPATKQSKGWICPYCDECADESKYKFIPIEIIHHSEFTDDGFVEIEIDERLDRMLKNKYGRDDYQDMLSKEFEKWVKENGQVE